MTGKNYNTVKFSVEIELPLTAQNVFDHLTELKKWWPEDFEGSELALNSIFSLSTGTGHYSKNRVIEFDQNKKLVWETLESFRKADGYDWSGTKFIFGLSPKDKSTIVKFTYDGAVLDEELNRLKEICDFTLKNMFFNYVMNGMAKR